VVNFFPAPKIIQNNLSTFAVGGHISLDERRVPIPGLDGFGLGFKHLRGFPPGMRRGGQADFNPPNNPTDASNNPADAGRNFFAPATIAGVVPTISAPVKTSQWTAAAVISGFATSQRMPVTNRAVAGKTAQTSRAGRQASRGIFSPSPWGEGRGEGGRRNKFCFLLGRPPSPKSSPSGEDFLRPHGGRSFIRPANPSCP